MKDNETLLVTIDGEEDTLTKQPGTNQYNTEGSVSGHRFPFKLMEGMSFCTNGCSYRIKKRIRV